MSYQAPLPNTGAILPVLGSGQAWEGSVYNGNFAGVDAAIGADRARLTTIEGKLVGNGLVPAGTSAARDGLYGVPSTAAGRVALANAAPRWFNTDAGKGYTQQYFAQDGDAGAGIFTRTAAGWYAAIDSARVPLSGFTTAVTGGTLTRDGGGLIVGAGVTSFSLNGCFSTDFRAFDFEIEPIVSAATDIFWRARNAGADTGASFNRTRLTGSGATATAASETGQSAGVVGRADSQVTGFIDFSVFNPMDATKRTLSKSHGVDTGNVQQLAATQTVTAAAHDGITFLVSAGTFSAGTLVRLYGRNPF